MTKLRFLPAATALLLCLSTQAGNRVLDTPLRFQGGGGALAIAADFTGDGRMDVLTAAAYAAVSPGRGDGTLGLPIYTIDNVAGQDQPKGVADFDRDGKLDVYLLPPNAAYSVMRGSGDGTFQTPVQAAGSPPDLITAGDFNGDTFADLVTFTASNNVLTLYAGNGSGGFAPGTWSPINFSGSADDVAAGDFDGDGKLDLLFTGDQQSAIAWNGGGSFTGLPLPLMPGKAAAAGDVNGDGRTDAVVINYTSIFAGGTASVAFGSAARNLALTQFPIEGNTQGDVTVAQMDGTGGSEIIIAMRDVTVYSHDGVNFRTPRSFVTGGPDISAVTAADLNGDGKTDIITSATTCILGNGDGTLAADPAFPIRPMLEGGFRQVVNVSDLNGDGRPDLTLIQRFGTNFAVSLANAAGFTTPVLTPLPELQQFWTASPAGDLNSDGRADVLLTSTDNSTTEHFSTWFVQANGTFVAGPMTTGAPASRASLMADLNGDGRTDIVDSGGRMYTALASGAFDGPFGTGIAATTTPMYAADVNHDGSLDVLVSADPGGGIAPLRVYLNSGTGSFGAAIDGGVAVDFVDGFADVTGDGIPELISHGAVYRGIGNGTFAPARFSLPRRDTLHGTPWAADFDGDGRPDVAASGAISYGAGDGTFESAVAISAAGEIISLADLDGNGSPDVWLADTETARIGVIRTRRRATGTAAAAVSLTIGGTSFDRSPFVGGQVASGEAAEIRGSVLVRVDSSNLALSLVTGTWGTHPLLPVGTFTVSALFSGDGYYGPSTASQSHTIEKRETYIDFPYGLANPLYGQPILISARVNGSDPVPTGVVTYRKGATTLGTSPAVPASPHQGELSFTDPALFPAGPHTITIEYSGDDGYLPAHVDQPITVRKAYRAATLSIQPATLFEGQQATITASFAATSPGMTTITGTVAFTWSGTTYTVPVTNGQAVLTSPLAWGNGMLTATYSGNANYESVFTEVHLVVYRSDMSFAPVTSATAALAVGDYLVTIAFSPLNGAASYDIYRSRDGAPLSKFTNWAASQPFYPTDRLPLGSVGVYAVVARGASGSSSPMSAKDLASGFTFLDDPLLPVSTKIKAAHVTQLQNAVNAVRVAAGLTATTFAAPAGIISAAHLIALRQALTQARGALGLTTTITDPTITPGVTRVRAIHLQELRDAVK